MTSSDDQPTGAPAKDMSALLEAMRPEDGAEHVTLGAILSRVGAQSFPAVLLLIGLLMVSPLSSVPLLPALLAVVILLTAGQAILGRRSLWLPRSLL
jgi:hypothetical protein